VSRNRPIPQPRGPLPARERRRFDSSSNLADRSSWIGRFAGADSRAPRDRFVFILQNIHYSPAALLDRESILRSSLRRCSLRVSDADLAISAIASELLARRSGRSVLSPAAGHFINILYNVIIIINHQYALRDSLIVMSLLSVV